MHILLWEFFFPGKFIGPFKSRPAFTGANGNKTVKDNTPHKSGKGVNTKTIKKSNIIKDDDILQD